MQMLNETTAGALEIGKLADQIVAAEDEIIDIGGQIGRMADSIVDCERKMCQFAEHVCHAVNGTCSAFTPITSNKKAGGKHHLPTTRNVVQPMQASAETLHAVASRAHVVQEKADQTLAQMQSYLKALPALMADAVKAASEVAVATAATAVSVRSGPAESTAPDYPLQSSAMVRFPNPLKWMTLMEQLMQKMVTMSGRMLKNMGEIIKAIAGLGAKIAETSKLIVEMAGQVTQMVSRIAETVNIVDKLVKDCT
jgi:methyl-accepting chemotaxis protein